MRPVFYLCLTYPINYLLHKNISVSELFTGAIVPAGFNQSNPRVMPMARFLLMPSHAGDLVPAPSISYCNKRNQKAMRTRSMTTLSTLASLGLMSLHGTASAAALTCITGENAVTVNSASACAVTPGQNDEQVDENGLIFNPGGIGPYSWTYLDKDNRSNDTILDNENNQINGALESWFTGGITDPGSQLNGTFSINVEQYLTLGFNTFLLYMKPGNDGVYFLLDGTVVNGFLTGTWNIANIAPPPPGNALSHMSLYGRFVEDRQVPEPGSLALLGLGLAGLGLSRRRKAA